MSGYTFKDTDLFNVISSGSTAHTGYQLNESNSLNYRPVGSMTFGQQNSLGFTYQGGTDIGQLALAKFTDYTNTTETTYNIPNWVNEIKVVSVSGGAGGNGGQGGRYSNTLSRNITGSPGNNGDAGFKKNYIISISNNRNIAIKCGTGGNGGNGGPKGGNTTSTSGAGPGGGPGNIGNETYIKINGTIYNTDSTNGTQNSGQNYINITSDSDFNNDGNNYAKGGNKGSGGNDSGGPGGVGEPGICRVYFLS
jgi:hypothetical protein